MTTSIMRLFGLTLGCALMASAAAPDSGLFPPAPGMPVKAMTPVMPSKPHVKGPRLVEPRLKMTAMSGETPTVALTFDACMGKVDERIMNTLVQNRIPATVFVTARWIRHNAPALSIMKANPDLFEIEDHGAEHIPAVDAPTKVYGIAAAGSPEAVAREVSGGADAIMAEGIARPMWFRGATAKYTPSSIRQIEAMGYKIAGFSINGDGGSLLGQASVEHLYAHARDGDVIISHINQPTHEAGAGVVNGILALKARGYQFVKLSDRAETLSAKGF